MHRWLLVFVSVLAGLLAVLTAAAQDDLDAVEVNGMKHLIHYDAVTDLLRITVRDAIEASLAVYEPLWAGVTPPIVVDLLPLPGADADGNPLVGGQARHTKIELLPFDVPDDTPDEICYIPLYTVPTSPEFEFRLAQEIAQCYMFFNVPAASALEYEFDPLNAWWGEGASLWLASEVYAYDSGLDWSKTQAAFLEGREDTLTKQGEGAYYFWISYVTATSKDVGISLLVFMPDDPNAQPEYVADKLVPDADNFMHKFVLNDVAGLALPNLPLAEDLYEAEILTSYPARIKIQSEPLGIGLLRISLSDLGDDEGVSLTLTDLTASGLTVSLADGMPLAEGETIDFCPYRDKITLVYSRALNGADIDPPQPANLNFDRIDCTEPPADESGAGRSVAECLVGTWTLTSVPYMPDTPPVTLGGSLQITVDAAGNTSTVYNNFSQTMSMESLGGGPGVMTVTVDGTATGKIAVDEAGFIIDSGEPDISRITAFASVAGTTIDLTSMIRDVAVVGMGMPANAQLTCTDTELRMLVEAGGFAGEYVFVR